MHYLLFTVISGLPCRCNGHAATYVIAIFSR